MTDMDMGAPEIRREVHHGRVVPCFRDRPVNVDAMLRTAVAAAPQRLAVIEGTQRLDYVALDRLVDAVAGHFASLGMKSGDRVAVLLENRPEYLVVALACGRMGAILVPMNIRQRLPEIEYMLNDSGAAALIHEAALADQIPPPDAVPALRHRFVIGGDYADWARLTAATSAGGFEPVDEDAPYCILYTSGTTGRPKGAVLTHCNVIHSCLHFKYHYGMRDGDCSLLAVPASHVTGLIGLLLATVCVAGCTVLMHSFKALHFLELASKERIGYTLMVPAMYSLMLMEPDFRDFDLSSWRIGGFGGAPMPQSVVLQLAEAMPQLSLFNTYGATETTSPAVIMPFGEGGKRPGQIGRPLICCDLRVMDDEGHEVPPGTSGEIWMAGPMVVPGYWQNEEATRNTFVDGYWKSGDIGSMDADGYVSVFDRKKDMINRGGFKIYSVEVENVLVACPGVIEAAVVSRPCTVLGERVEAFVYSRDNISEATLRHFCAERLSDYKVPEHVRVLTQALPRNANGKLLKTVMRSWLDD